MENMSRFRVNSSPDLIPLSMNDPYDDTALEGVAANVKLLLKLIQDHKDACMNKKNDGRRMLRVAGMMTILDNVRTRIQKCQSFGNKSSEGQLRGCNTDLQGKPPMDKRPAEPITHENEKLRKDLSASLAARKNLEVMCSSLGKEKEIMAGELARKVRELHGMEELVHDLRAQNETLLEKIKENALEQKDKCCQEVRQGNAALRERNKAIADQLLKALDGYRSMKRKNKEAQEENAGMRTTLEEMEEEIAASLESIRGFKQGIANESKQVVDFEEISGLEHRFECLEMKISKHVQKKG